MSVRSAVRREVFRRLSRLGGRRMRVWEMRREGGRRGVRRVEWRWERCG